jgi:hypothetical protein
MEQIKNYFDKYHLNTILMFMLIILGSSEICYILEILFFIATFTKIMQNNKNEDFNYKREFIAYLTIMACFKIFNIFKLFEFMMLNLTLNICEIYIFYNIYMQKNIYLYIVNITEKFYNANKYTFNKINDYLLKFQIKYYQYIESDVFLL